MNETIFVMFIPVLTLYDTRCGSRIWSRGAQLLRWKFADAAEQSCVSKVSYLSLWSRACLRALEAFWFLMLKYEFSNILETLFSVIFDIYFSTKSKDLYFQFALIN